ncbi:SAM-dependent methyltransferase [Nocardia sp. 2]|uniref:SAM-dependent methyltransferase n=1 Tax=Nocardia acididurans TaxID=2802282 RepID=A0ABS1M3Y0_9NOCA|nr:SAM-dependent methyltransferase [Nocardia acididurans]MBL1075352.1 SAM-dependent methyltransferase [Nocardia acididurans]
MSKSSAYPSAAPVGVDSTRPSIARVYDAALNGKDNFEIDREVLAQMRTVAPGVAEIAWANRDYLIRTCRFLAREAGIDQYLDLGSGLPTAENTHQVVQRIAPEARVVYVDNDPMVLAHARALLADRDRTAIVDADIFRPFEVLRHPDIRARLDFTRPIALLQNGTLHHYLGDDAALIMRTYIDALPSGSYVSIAHLYNPETPEHGELARNLEEKLCGSLGSGRFRTRAEIEAMFDSLTMIDPGLVLCDDWWPDGPRLAHRSAVRHCVVGGVGRKP